MTLDINPKFNAIMSLLAQVISLTSATGDVCGTLINTIGLKFKSWGMATYLLMPRSWID